MKAPKSIVKALTYVMTFWWITNSVTYRLLAATSNTFVDKNDDDYYLNLFVEYATKNLANTV